MNQENLPKAKITLDEVINQSFKYWKATLSFQFVVTFLYFGIIFISGFQLVQYYFGDKLYIFTPELLQDPIKFNLKIRELLATENGSYFQIVLSLLKASLFPLFIGLFRVYTLIDEGKKPNLSEVLDGYKGSNFFKLWGYAIFWNVIFSLGMSFFFIPGVLWVFLTVFVGPLLYFTPMRMLEAINISAKVAWANWKIVLPCAIIAFLFSYSGFILFFVAFLFTYPFWNAIIYTLFKKFFSIKFV